MLALLVLRLSTGCLSLGYTLPPDKDQLWRDFEASAMLVHQSNPGSCVAYEEKEEEEEDPLPPYRRAACRAPQEAPQVAGPGPAGMWSGVRYTYVKVMRPSQIPPMLCSAGHH